jgi:hypothetical protein
VASIDGFVLDAGEQSRRKSRDGEDLGKNGWADEIKECLAVLSPLFIGRGEHGGCDTTTATVKRWRRLESLSECRSFISG